MAAFVRSAEPIHFSRVDAKRQTKNKKKEKKYKGKNIKRNFCKKKSVQVGHLLPVVLNRCRTREDEKRRGYVEKESPSSPGRP